MTEETVSSFGKKDGRIKMFIETAFPIKWEIDRQKRERKKNANLYHARRNGCQMGY